MSTASGECDECGRVYPASGDHLLECAQCERAFCFDCMNTGKLSECAECGQSVCANCLIEDRCATCYMAVDSTGSDALV